MIACIPGNWNDRSDLLARVVRESRGEFMFAGLICAQVKKNRHCKLEFTNADSAIGNAFEIAGGLQLDRDLLKEISSHTSVVYLIFDSVLPELTDELKDFTRLLSRLGGIAIKIESTGVAFGWNSWFERIESTNPFDSYRTFVTLIGDEDYFYSCGMHHYGFPDVEVASKIGPNTAADLMNQFNFWRVVEKPTLAAGHTFSLTPVSRHYRLTHVDDTRHLPDDPFHNPTGIWRLE